MVRAFRIARVQRFESSRKSSVRGMNAAVRTAGNVTTREPEPARGGISLLKY